MTGVEYVRFGRKGSRDHIINPDAYPGPATYCGSYPYPTDQWSAVTTAPVCQRCQRGYDKATS
jgi:hypothetical protein